MFQSLNCRGAKLLRTKYTDRKCWEYKQSEDSWQSFGRPSREAAGAASISAVGPTQACRACRHLFSIVLPEVSTNKPINKEAYYRSNITITGGSQVSVLWGRCWRLARRSELWCEGVMNVTHVTELRDSQPASYWYQNSSHLCYGPDPELDKDSGVSYCLLNISQIFVQI